MQFDMIHEIRWVLQVHMAFWWRNLRERDYLEGLGVRWQDNIKMGLKEILLGGRGLGCF